MMGLSSTTGCQDTSTTFSLYDISYYGNEFYALDYDTSRCYNHIEIQNIGSRSWIPTDNIREVIPYENCEKAVQMMTTSTMNYNNNNDTSYNGTTDIIDSGSAASTSSLSSIFMYIIPFITAFNLF